MSEIDEDSPYGVEGGLERWLNDDVSSTIFGSGEAGLTRCCLKPHSSTSASENESPPALYEQSLDRMAFAMGGKAVLPPAFQVGISLPTVLE
jgi:importin-5